MQKIICRLLYVLAVLCAVEASRAQGTAFTYQGQLNDGGSSATGNYDLRFQVFDAVTNGNAISVPLTNAATAVNNGLFTTTLDFGAGIFTGTNYWLQIGVQTNGLTNAFITLFPRQPVLPTPYAIFANSASNLLGMLAAAQLSGTLPESAFAGFTNTVSFTNSANFFSGTFFNGTFSGNGTNLVNLNASQLTGGTVADARLSTNVALLNASQTFSSVNTFTNFGNSFRGSFFGNGLVGWLVQTGTTVQAVIDTGYVLTNSQLVTVILPTNVNIGDIVRISGAGLGGWKISQNSTQSVVGNFSGYTNSYWTVSGAAAAKWTSIAMSSDGNKLVAAGDNAGLFDSADGGLTWSQGTGSPPGADGAASSADGTKLVAVFNNGGLGGGIFTSTDSGATWQNTGPGNSNWCSVASSADGTKLVAVISNSVAGGIFSSSSSGQSGTWSRQSTAAKWVSVASSADGTKLVAVQFGGGIFTNSGSTWANATTSIGSKNWISVASSADGSKLAAAISGGGIFTSVDSGKTWFQSGAPTANWVGVASSADGGKLAAVVNTGGIYLSSNFGATWAQQTKAPLGKWQSIATSSDGTKLAAAINNATATAPPVGIYLSQASLQISSMTGTNGYISGSQGTAVELQYIGNGQFMPVSSAGTIWAN
jgi:photosystem II stability/assembly factor-like uncharacterized protein